MLCPKPIRNKKHEEINQTNIRKPKVHVIILLYCREKKYPPSKESGLYIDTAKAEETAKKLLLKLHENIKLNDKLGDAHGSIGIEMVSTEGENNYENVLINADRALYVTKEQGRFGYTVYSNEHMKSHRMEV